MDLQNKVAVVAGGASGLGRAAVSALVKRGMKAAIFDLNDDEGERVATELGDGVMYLRVDVTNAGAVEQAVAKVLEAFGAVHLCLNCAGICPSQKILDREGSPMPLDDFARVLNINLVGTFNMARVCAAAMAQNEPLGEAAERGVIINTASVAAYEGQVGQSAYAASKAGVVGLTVPMARDLAPRGIRVMTIAPGIMGTPMLMNMPEKVQDSLVANVQFPKRLGLPEEEFGGLVVHIMENTYLNGETIRLDGGIRMPAR